MSTQTEKMTALKTWAMFVSGYDAQHVIAKNAGGPRPDGPYLVITPPVTSEETGPKFVSSRALDAGDTTTTHTKVVVVRVGIDVLAEDAADVLDKMDLALAGYQSRGVLSGADLTFVRKTGPVYIPEYSDTDPRHRYRGDFYFYTQIDFQESDYELQQLQATGQLTTPDDKDIDGDFQVGEVD